MDTIRLENFRCFRKKQSARLAPLTLLVGDNSTGKTSFMAMIRALWQLAYRDRIPDFKEEPYDLGSFDEIAHYRGGGRRADSFCAGFDVAIKKNETSTSFDYTFERNGTAPIPVRREISFSKTWINEVFQDSRKYLIRVGTNNGSWDMQYPDEPKIASRMRKDLRLPPLYFLLGSNILKPIPLESSPPITVKDIDTIIRLSSLPRDNQLDIPFASAPVRSKPQRTYDPSSISQDPEGDYIPMLLAYLSLDNQETWAILKKRLEGFGVKAGLFNEIIIRHLGGKVGDPFQVQIRKFDGSFKGPKRNLVDMGYGVTQVLPIITELLFNIDFDNGRPLFLLQQPEVDLHPSAQAALGSLFCQVASPFRQLIVETHSDHLLDRVRMDIRDVETSLKPEDVSILFFEREGLDVNIHSIGIDSEGRIVGAPRSYRRFFMKEITRSVWKRRSVAGN